MGGSASDAIEKLKPRSAQGFDIQTLGKGGAHINRQLQAGIGTESALGKGLEHNFTQIHQGIGEGIKKFGSELDSFVERNTRSLRPPSRPGQEAQTASANYTGQSQTQRSGSGKRGSGKLTSKDTKKKQGKRSLTIQK